MIRDNSISVVIPALNEEKGLVATVLTVSKAVQRKFDDCEIIIVNNGSRDKTAEIANQLAEEYDCVRVVHHKQPSCLGRVYKEGLRLARMNYFIRVNGKNDITQSELENIFRLCGKADLIVPYTVNTSERPLIRQAIAKFFTATLNFITGLHLQYYNHSVLCKRELLNTISISTDSYAFQAEILIKLIKFGYAYIEVGIRDTFRRGVKTKAFYLKNIFGVLAFLARIIYNECCKKQSKKVLQ